MVVPVAHLRGRQGRCGGALMPPSFLLPTPFQQCCKPLRRRLSGRTSVGSSSVGAFEVMMTWQWWRQSEPYSYLVQAVPAQVGVSFLSCEELLTVVVVLVSVAVVVVEDES